MEHFKDASCTIASRDGMATGKACALKLFYSMFPFFCKKGRKGVFLAFVSGEQRISHLAAVKRGRRPSRSDAELFSGALLTGIAR